jgi:uncharacterized repeat protein (TIGR01451 family)
MNSKHKPTANAFWHHNRSAKTAALAMFFATTCFTPSAFAAGTLAGTDITNTATASYETPGGGSVEIDSNTVIFKVDELLDVVVDNSDPGDVLTTPGETGEVVKFLVTNGGNGSEAFTLAANVNRTGDDFNPSLTQIVLDTNGNGVYDAGVDTVYVAGTNDPVLAPDQSLTVFVIVDTPATAVDGNRAEVNLSAVAKTGSGAPGTSLDGLGDGGGDAVVGATGADGDDSGFLALQAAILELIKSATIADPFGGTTAVPGSVITYQIRANITGSGSLPKLVVSDPIPANTTYAPASITLEGVTQSDAVDTDVSNFDGSKITVNMGTVPAGETRTITFKVTIR